MKKKLIINTLALIFGAVGCGYFGTQLLGRKAMSAFGGAICVTAIAHIIIVGFIDEFPVEFSKPLPPSFPLSCIGCKFFHGRSYNGVIMNCAPHPKGPVNPESPCPDWEK